MGDVPHVCQMEFLKDNPLAEVGFVSLRLCGVINAEMGWRRVDPIMRLHRRLQED